MIKNRIKQLREENHMTQIRLSVELEVSQETISAYESGKHYPSVTSLIKMAQIFHTSCDYILGLSDNKYAPINNTLSTEEKELLFHWNNLDASRKKLLLAYIDGLTAVQNN